MLETRGPAPDFMLASIENRDATYMLSAATNEGPVVLAFGAAPGTAARELFDDLNGIDWGSLVDRIAVFGICGSESVARDCAERGYPFPVLVDGTGYVAELYDLPETADGRTGQALVLVDRECTVAYGWESADPGAEPPLGALESAVTALSE